ncbi:DMT family transporter [Geodermatophilus sp. URMC 62]|uniref:DMT family transporter n=1 Tax=Geodermatophilus sp. URMC 62 TaxID=3423414 RepID=UPI00406C6D45
MWLWLAVAILSEVTATLCLRASEGLTRLVPSLVMVLGYAVAFFALSRALVAGMSVGHAYAVWAGLGVALIAALGTVLFGDRLTPVQLGGLVLVVVGVVAIELGGARHA